MFCEKRGTAFCGTDLNRENSQVHGNKNKSVHCKG